MAFEQLESVWPIHGSVLVENDVVYFVAGRSSFLDSGMRFFRVHAETGRKISEGLMDDRDPHTGEDLQNHIKVLQMPVALPDILSSDSVYVYLRSQQIDMEGNRLEIARIPAILQDRRQFNVARLNTCSLPWASSTTLGSIVPIGFMAAALPVVMEDTTKQVNTHHRDACSCLMTTMSTDMDASPSI